MFVWAKARQTRVSQKIARYLAPENVRSSPKKLNSTIWQHRTQCWTRFLRSSRIRTHKIRFVPLVLSKIIACLGSCYQCFPVFRTTHQQVSKHNTSVTKNKIAKSPVNLKWDVLQLRCNELSVWIYVFTCFRLPCSVNSLLITYKPLWNCLNTLSLRNGVCE